MPISMSVSFGYAGGAVDGPFVDWEPLVKRLARYSPKPRVRYDLAQ